MGKERRVKPRRKKAGGHRSGNSSVRRRDLTYARGLSASGIKGEAQQGGKREAVRPNFLGRFNARRHVGTRNHGGGIRYYRMRIRRAEKKPRLTGCPMEKKQENVGGGGGRKQNRFICMQRKPREDQEYG